MEDDEKVKVEMELTPKQLAKLADKVNDEGEDQDEKEQRLKRKEEKLKKKEEELEKKEEGKKTQEESKKEEKSDSGDESLVKKATGYEASELLSAPVSPPEAEASKKPGRGQIRSLLIGFILIIVSLIIWPILGWRTAVAILIIGAAYIAIGVLFRI